MSLSKRRRVSIWIMIGLTAYLLGFFVLQWHICKNCYRYGVDSSHLNAIFESKSYKIASKDTQKSMIAQWANDSIHKWIGLTFHWLLFVVFVGAFYNLFAKDDEE